MNATCLRNALAAAMFSLSASTLLAQANAVGAGASAPTSAPTVAPAAAASDSATENAKIAWYALIAWPERWGDTGIMNFIVSRDGVVYQKNVGPGTDAAARKVTVYNPDSTWERAGAAK